MRSVFVGVATVSLLGVSLSGVSAAQSRVTLSGGGFVPGSRELFSIDFAAEPLGEFPKRLKLLSGNLTMVMKDGVPALRASDPAGFLINLSERLPQDFTLEFDILPKACCNPVDLAFEGTPTQDRGPASMMVEWHAERLATIGGGPMFQMNMPAELKPLLPSQPTEIRASFQGTTFTLYTNGQQIFTVDRKFPRGRVFRILLGGQDDDKYAVYLTKLRIATNLPAPSGTASNSQALSGSSIASSSQSTPTAVGANSPGTAVGSPTAIPVSAPSGPGVTSGPLAGGTPPTAGGAAAVGGTTSSQSGQKPGPPGSGGSTGGSGSGTPTAGNPTIATTQGTVVGGTAAAPTAIVATMAPAPLPPNAGRYRVTITGFAASKGTVDDPRDYDGVKDEVYAAAAAVLWDRTNSTVRGQSVIRSREYGDVGNGQRGTRIQAGSATVTGGIWGGNGTDFAPQQYDPRGSALPAASIDQLPLLVWEGILTDGLDGLLIVPSLWESDQQPRGYDNYQTSWKSSPISVLSSPTVQRQLNTPTISSAVVPKNPAVQVANALTTLFTGGLVGSFGFISMLATANLDRPIGLAPGGNATEYQDRLVVITREKLKTLQPGYGTTVSVPFAEPANGSLDGVYMLYLRVDRIQ